MRDRRRLRLSKILLLRQWLIVLVCAFFSLEASAERRVALVVGNSKYTTAPLKNPENDARAIAAVLKKLGFDVDERRNTSKIELERAVADFQDRITDGSVALFYYAGHAMQLDGLNYLIPVDAKITTAPRVRLEALDAGVVIDHMSAARMSIVILDACRNNPFEIRTRSSGAGLAQINAPAGTLIAYATAPGRVAFDGSENNSIYTDSILAEIETPGIPVEEFFKRVRGRVNTSSQGAQVPWESSSLVGSFSFVPNVHATIQSAQPMVDDADTLFWRSIASSSRIADFEAYIAAFPAGRFAYLAKSKLRDAQQDSQAPKRVIAYSGTAGFEQIPCGQSPIQAPGAPCLRGPRSPQGYSQYRVQGRSGALHFDLYRIDGGSAGIPFYDYKTIRRDLDDNLLGYGISDILLGEVRTDGSLTTILASAAGYACFAFDLAGGPVGRAGGAYPWRTLGLVCDMEKQSQFTPDDVRRTLSSIRIVP